MTARGNTILIWNRADLRRFLTTTEGHVLHVLWTFAASTGMRRSELLSRWLADLDPDAAPVTDQPTAGQESHTAPEEDDQ